jgi:hypothetical protein
MPWRLTRFCSAGAKKEPSEMAKGGGAYGYRCFGMLRCSIIDKIKGGKNEKV